MCWPSSSWSCERSCEMKRDAAQQMCVDLSRALPRPRQVLSTPQYTVRRELLGYNHTAAGVCRAGAALCGPCVFRGSACRQRYFSGSKSFQLGTFPTLALPPFKLQHWSPAYQRFGCSVLHVVPSLMFCLWLPVLLGSHSSLAAGDSVAKAKFIEFENVQKNSST